jgi:hypothetical protein
VGTLSLPTVIFVVCPGRPRPSVARWPKFWPKSTKWAYEKKSLLEEVKAKFYQTQKERGCRNFINNFLSFSVVYWPENDQYCPLASLHLRPTPPPGPERQLLAGGGGGARIKFLTEHHQKEP